MTKTEKGRIVNKGQGGFLNPPGHPEHSFHVETDLRRRPENRGGMSLSYAVSSTWLAPETRAEARKLLKDWSLNKLPLDNADVQKWVLSVLGYFRNCYRNPSVAEAEQFNASNVIVDSWRDPLAAPADHAGVNHIRRFYPEYVPTAEDFAKANWGN